MKTTLTAIFLLILSTSISYGNVCLDLEKDKESQIKRLEIAKIKIFEQDSTSVKSIKEKQDEKITAIRQKTARRLSELEIIQKDLQDLPNQSEMVTKTIETLGEQLAIYNNETESALLSFASGTNRILEDKSKVIKSVVEQYELGLLQTYEKSLISCKNNGTYDETSFAQEIKVNQKRVIDAEKNSKRILQGIDALYATLSLELDKSDTSLNLTLKSIRTSLLANPPKDLKPLSLFRLWKML